MAEQGDHGDQDGRAGYYGFLILIMTLEHVKCPQLQGHSGDQHGCSGYYGFFILVMTLEHVTCPQLLLGQYELAP